MFQRKIINDSKLFQSGSSSKFFFSCPFPTCYGRADRLKSSDGRRSTPSQTKPRGPYLFHSKFREGRRNGPTRGTEIRRHSVPISGSSDLTGGPGLPVLTSTHGKASPTIGPTPRDSQPGPKLLHCNSSQLYSPFLLREEIGGGLRVGLEILPMGTGWYPSNTLEDDGVK